jgi:predicted secreted protein
MLSSWLRKVVVAVLWCLCTVATGAVAMSGDHASAAEPESSTFLLTLRPTEGVLLEFVGPSDRKAAHDWTIDPAESNGLDHVDVVDVGTRPSRIDVSNIAPKERLKSLFETPKVWAWGIRARTAGHARIVLMSDTQSDSTTVPKKQIDVQVVDEGRDAQFRLPFNLGERALLEIWTNPSTGAQWRIDVTASTGLASIKVEPGRTYDPSDPTDWRQRNKVGAPLLQLWQIDAVAAGAAHVVLDYGPPWEKKTLYRQVHIDATVQPHYGESNKRPK